MLNKRQVAAMLAGRSAKALSVKANVSIKTIQRLRNPDHSGDPSMETVRKLLEAMAQLDDEERQAKAMKRKPAAEPA